MNLGGLDSVSLFKTHRIVLEIKRATKKGHLLKTFYKELNSFFAIFLDFPENLRFFITSKLDLSSPTITNPIIPIVL
jgi:hypothetical protein